MVVGLDRRFFLEFTQSSDIVHVLSLHVTEFTARRAQYGLDMPTSDTTTDDALADGITRHDGEINGLAFAWLEAGAIPPGPPKSLKILHPRRKHV